jgi:hypothetical protein
MSGLWKQKLGIKLIFCRERHIINTKNGVFFAGFILKNMGKGDRINRINLTSG